MSRSSSETSEIVHFTEHVTDPFQNQWNKCTLCDVSTQSRLQNIRFIGQQGCFFHFLISVLCFVATDSCFDGCAAMLDPLIFLFNFTMGSATQGKVGTVAKWHLYTESCRMRWIFTLDFSIPYFRDASHLSNFPSTLIFVEDSPPDRQNRSRSLWPSN